MAQIIKIQDYISRYEQDPHHYINQFIRLKKQRWDELKKASKEGAQHQFDQITEQTPEEEEKRTKFSLKRKPKAADMKKERDLSLFNEPIDIEQGVFRNVPTDETKLIHFFKDHLYDVQLKWASSTISHISTVSHHIRYDEKLRMLARQLPDSYFVMYKPVMLIQKAEMELCTVLISPLEVICLSFLEAEPDSVYIGSKERFWEKRATGKAVQSVLNPCASLLRSGTVVSKILDQSGVDLPVKKSSSAAPLILTYRMFRMEWKSLIRKRRRNGLKSNGKIRRQQSISNLKRQKYCLLMVNQIAKEGKNGSIKS